MSLYEINSLPKANTIETECFWSKCPWIKEPDKRVKAERKMGKKLEDVLKGEIVGQITEQVVETDRITLNYIVL